jgi:leucyl-tRNA synthetase
MMLNCEEIIKNESLEEIILFFSGRPGGIGYIKLDQLFVLFRHSAIADGELLLTTQRMYREGMIENRGHSMVFFKGLNWKEPAFMTEKKYGIV